MVWRQFSYCVLNRPGLFYETGNNQRIWYKIEYTKFSFALFWYKNGLTAENRWTSQRNWCNRQQKSVFIGVADKLTWEKYWVKCLFSFPSKLIIRNWVKTVAIETNNQCLKIKFTIHLHFAALLITKNIFFVHFSVCLNYSFSMNQ